MQENLFDIKTGILPDAAVNNSSFYQIIAFNGTGRFMVDFAEYSFSGNTILFLTPHQDFQWINSFGFTFDLLQFHGDFYCIEYHKKEVACNGLLFNNIYLQPHINVTANDFAEIKLLFKKLADEKNADDVYSLAVVRAYLQLILALCSKEKINQVKTEMPDDQDHNEITVFQNLLEANFLRQRSPSFYAAAMSLSLSAFSKKIKKQFRKTPSEIIQERIILEAKKLLHLTYKSVKEIAAELNFEDEFYFSRYFKKNTGLSPLHYRESVGISIAAK